MARVYEGQKTFLHPSSVPWSAFSTAWAESRREEQRWTQYAASLLAFSAVCFVFAYAIQRLQGSPAAESRGIRDEAGDAGLSFNTAVSFMTNTNWQSYGGETTLSYFVQMAASDRAEFRFGGGGNGGCDSSGPGICATAAEYHRQLLGRSGEGNRVHPACRSR